ncbi:Crp/Fnr family transcriptional regulator [Marinobacterium jannaschii]|uniref:Crp/Fnr family transcriptional regulator n=1 Tax=Marinobacterium jannaschii TaxID=64970 RepID=UPI000683FB51|nr:cyclic nucleotide-binding domain-containing protein [Marinobacterium jannaschii]
MHALSPYEIQRRFPPEFCRQLSMFGALGEECVHYLLHEGSVMMIENGEQLMQKGDLSDHFYILLTGRLAYFRYIGDSPVHVRSFAPGEQVGFVGMIGLIERLGDVFAEEETVALQVSCDLFHQVCERYSADFVIFMINMTREMSREITELDAKCAELNLLLGDQV